MTLTDQLFLFFPILIITLFILYPNDIIVASHTILGKLVIILLILFYAFKDLIYAIFLTLLVIIYYQTDTYENMLDLSSIMGENSSIVHPKDKGKNFVSNSDFTDKYCVNGELMFKNMVVKPEMSEHIFPEIHFKNERCNVCDSTCKFEIVNEPERVLLYKQNFGVNVF